MLLDYLFGLYGKFYFQKAVFGNLSRRVWIIFRLNFKTFFWRCMLSLYLALQILLSNVLPKEPSILFVTLMAGLRIIWKCPRNSEQVYSIFIGLLFSFPKKFAQGPTRSSSQDVCGFIFDICNDHEIVPYDWVYSQYWGCVKMVDLFLVC